MRVADAVAETIDDDVVGVGRLQFEFENSGGIQGVARRPGRVDHFERHAAMCVTRPEIQPVLNEQRIGARRRIAEHRDPDAARGLGERDVAALPAKTIREAPARLDVGVEAIPRAAVAAGGAKREDDVERVFHAFEVRHLGCEIDRPRVPDVVRAGVAPELAPSADPGIGRCVQRLRPL